VRQRRLVAVAPHLIEAFVGAEGRQVAVDQAAAAESAEPARGGGGGDGFELEPLLV
jgi:hypothetical protein